MKNKLFASAFALMGTFAMANEITSAEKNVENTKSNEVVESENCISVNYSCGASADICNFKGTTQQLLNMVWVQDELICSE